MPEVVDSLGCLLSFSGRERSSDRKAAVFAGRQGQVTIAVVVRPLIFFMVYL